MKIFLAGQNGREWIIRGYMKLYLAGQVESLKKDMQVFLASSGGLWEAYFSCRDFAHAYILESFFYADDFTEQTLIPNSKEFMLDSGAFTFMENSKIRVDWDEYTERYADFINRNKVDLFFELDIDSIEGYEEVKRLRSKLEKLTGKQCIPVWHSTRGIEEFKRSCEEYSYVALGGIVGKEWKKEAEKYIPWFINYAHKNGAKIHGLGFTKLKLLPSFHFDSVDSTSWTTGNRYGFLYRFDGRTMQMVKTPPGHRLADAKRVALNNYTEWVKFQRYAETHL